MEQESKQAEATVEQPKEEISKETPKVTPTEKKATSEKTYSEVEWGKMQSMKDKAESKALRYEQELQELRKQGEQQRLEARRKEITELADEPEEQVKVRRKHQLEDEVTKLQDQKVTEEGAVQRKYDQAIDLATQHNLNLDDARELMSAGSPKEMELMAQLKVAEQAKGQTKTPTEETGVKPDSGTSDAGADSDKAFLKSYSEGKSDDHARAEKLLSKIK